MKNLTFNDIVKNHPSLKVSDELDKEFFDILKCSTKKDFDKKIKLLEKQYELISFVDQNSKFEKTYMFKWKVNDSILPFKIYPYFEFIGEVSGSDVQIVLEKNFSNSFLERISFCKSYEQNFNGIWFFADGYIKPSLEELVSCINQNRLKEIRRECKYLGNEKENFMTFFEKSYKLIAGRNKYRFEIKDNQKLIFQYDFAPQEIHSSLVKEIFFNKENGIIEIEFLNGAKEILTLKTETIFLVKNDQFSDQNQKKNFLKWDKEVCEFVFADFIS
jgi:hypothetical protein